MDLTSQIFWSIVLPLFNEVAGGILGDWADFLVFLVSHQQNEGSIAVMETLLSDAMQMMETKIFEFRKECGNYCDLMNLTAEQEDKFEVLKRDLKQFKSIMNSMKHPGITYACSDSAKEWNHAYVDLLIDVCGAYESGLETNFEKLSQKHYSDFEKRDCDEETVALYRIAIFLLSRNKKEVLQKFPKLHDENFLRTEQLNEVRRARISFAQCADSILDHELLKKFIEAIASPPRDEASWAQYLFNIFSCMDLESNEVDSRILNDLRYGLEVFAKEQNTQDKEKQNKHIEKCLESTKRSLDAKYQNSPTFSPNNKVLIALIQMNFHHHRDLQTNKDALISSDWLRSVIDSMKKLGLKEYETFWYFLETIKKTSLGGNIAKDILEILNNWRKLSVRNKKLFDLIENEMKVKMSQSNKRSRAEEIEKKKNEWKRRRVENKMRKLEKDGLQKKRRTKKGMQFLEREDLQRRPSSSRRVNQEYQEQVHEDQNQVHDDQNQIHDDQEQVHPEMEMDLHNATNSSLVTITQERGELIMGLVILSRPRIQAMMKGFSDFPHPIRVMENEKAIQDFNDFLDKTTCRAVVQKLVEEIVDGNHVERYEYHGDTTSVPRDDQEEDVNQGITSESGDDLNEIKDDDNATCRDVIQKLIEKIADGNEVERDEIHEEETTLRSYEILEDELEQNAQDGSSNEGSAPQEALDKRSVPSDDQETDEDQEKIPESGEDQDESEDYDFFDDGIDLG
ncbi:hypothetical protein CRE_21564 [Caenorhabditis remanei]|uniref:Uncharacterized protein n=1 Tax=Caenorhabditis remanei TaxID=31234 RepID=E3NFM7_CAERE|nr:hypothetical protein CRE_21564 [Caenorhabditis remanei]